MRTKKCFAKLTNWLDKKVEKHKGSIGDAMYKLEKKTVRYMILEGDYTNMPIETLPFVEGIQSVGDLVEDESDVNFGKYKGVPVSEVLQKDAGYFGWMLNSDFTLNTKAELTKIKLRELTGK